MADLSGMIVGRFNTELRSLLDLVGKLFPGNMKLKLIDMAFTGASQLKPESVISGFSEQTEPYDYLVRARNETFFSEACPKIKLLSDLPVCTGFANLTDDRKEEVWERVQRLFTLCSMYRTSTGQTDRGLECAEAAMEAVGPAVLNSGTMSSIADSLQIDPSDPLHGLMRRLGDSFDRAPHSDNEPVFARIMKAAQAVAAEYGDEGDILALVQSSPAAKKLMSKLGGVDVERVMSDPFAKKE